MSSTPRVRIGISFATFLALVTFGTGVYANDNPIHSYSEGILSKEHDMELARKRAKYLLDRTGQLSIAKLEQTVAHFEIRRASVAESVRMARKTWLIESRGYSEERAEKSAADETEVLIGFDALLESSKSLLAQMRSVPEPTPQQRADWESQADRIMLLISASDTLKYKDIYSHNLRNIRNAAKLWYDIPLDDSRLLQASNLMLEGKFLSAAELARKRQQGMDLSLLDPPSGAFWSNNLPEKYDPNDGVVSGQQLFPPEDAVLTYKRMGFGTIKIKADWGKKGVSLRVGKEAQTVVASGHLARAVGFNAIPYQFRKRVKLKLKGVTYDQFLADWQNAHRIDEGTAASYVEQYIPSEDLVILRDVAIESYPDKDHYLEAGMFLSDRNGFRNRREYRAQLIYAALIALTDTGDHQTRMDLRRDSKNAPWEPLFFISDTGWSFGPYLLFANPGTPNEYSTRLAMRHDGKGRILWNQVGLNESTFHNATYSDVRWILRRYARLSAEQIDQIFLSAGWPRPIALSLAERFKRRLNNMLEVFDLVRDSVPMLPTREWTDLHEEFPEVISRKGELKPEAENLRGSRARVLGVYSPPAEFVQLQGINFLQNLLHDALTIRPALFGLGETVSIGEYDIGIGPKMGGSRTIELNSERGPGQNRYLVKDTYTISVPIGLVSHDKDDEEDKFRLVGPLAFYYVYTYSHFHSHVDIKTAATAGFFKNFNPWSILSIRKNLKVGESLHVSSSAGVSIGALEFEGGDLVKVKLAPIKVSRDYVSEFYFGKTSEQFLDALVTRSDTTAEESGLSVELMLKLSLSSTVSKSERRYRYYRFDLAERDENDREYMQEAYRRALVKNDFSRADKIAKKYDIRETQLTQTERVTFAIWDKIDSKRERDLDVELFGAAEDVNGSGSEARDISLIAMDRNQLQSKKYSIGVASHYKESERSINHLWSDRLTLGLGNAIANILGAPATEAQSRSVDVEATYNDELTGFTESRTRIQIDRVDLSANRVEFERDFLQYFNRRAGPSWTRDNPLGIEKGYLEWTMPPKVKAYSPLSGRMMWQISQTGINQLIAALKRKETLTALAQNQPIPFWIDRGDFNQRYFSRVLALITTIERPIATEAKDSIKRATLRSKLTATVDLIRAVIGTDNNQLGWLRKWIREDDLWLVTYLSGPLEVEVPTTADGKNPLHAREIGKFQGHTFLERLTLQQAGNPDLYYRGGIADRLSPFEGRGARLGDLPRGI